MFPQDPALELLERARDEAAAQVESYRATRDQAAELLAAAERRRDALQAAIDTLDPPADEPSPADEPAADGGV